MADSEETSMSSDMISMFVEFFERHHKKIIDNIDVKAILRCIQEELSAQDIKIVNHNQDVASRELVYIVRQRMNSQLPEKFMDAVKTCHPHLYKELISDTSAGSTNHIFSSSTGIDTRQQIGKHQVRSPFLEGVTLNGESAATTLNYSLRSQTPIAKLEIKGKTLPNFNDSSTSTWQEPSPMTIDELCIILENCPQIRSLSLEGYQIGLANFKRIKEPLLNMTSLCELSLSNDTLSPDNMDDIREILRSTGSLTSLHLNKNNLTDDDVYILIKTVSQKKEIIALSMADNQLTDKSAIFIHRHIPEKHQIKSLNLAGNQIGTIGAEKLRRRSKCIIDLQHNQIDTTNIVIPSNVLCDGNHIGSKRLDVIKSRLEAGQGFTHLALDNIAIDDRDIIVLAIILDGYSTLKKLTLDQNALTESSLIPLVKLFHSNENIIVLSIKNNEINDTRFEVMNRPCTRKAPFAFRPEFWAVVNDSGMHVSNKKLLPLDVYLLLNTFPGKVSTLEIRDCKIGDFGITPIIEYLGAYGNSITSLCISGRFSSSGNRMLQDSIIVNLENLKLSRLEFLEISNTSMKIKTVAKLVELGTFETLDLSGNELQCSNKKDHLEAIRYCNINEHLQVVSLKRTIVPEDTLICLAQLLGTSNSLRVVDLSENCIRPSRKTEILSGCKDNMYIMFEED